MGWYDAAMWAYNIIRDRQIVRPRDFEAMGAASSWLYTLKGLELEQVGPGLFCHPLAKPDEALLLARKYPRLAMGALSALWIHDYIRRPECDWWIIGIRDRVPTLPSRRARFIRSSWATEDVEEGDFGSGITVRAQSVTRAVLECIRHRRKIGPEAVDAALKKVFERPFDRDALAERARKLHVLAPLRAWLAGRAAE
jgi:hypothetical protein